MTECAKLTLRTFDTTTTFNATTDSATNWYHLTPNASGVNGFTTPFATTGAYNAQTVIDAKTNFTWTNINLRAILGDMYDRYDKFMLRIDSIVQSAAYNVDGNTGYQIGSNADDLLLNINIGGLPFLHSNYNTTTKNTTSSFPLCTYKVFKALGSTNMVSYTDTFATFGKGQDLANINIYYTRVIDNQMVSTGATSVYPYLTFYFTIFGVPNEDNKLLTPSTRMDNNTGRLR